MKFCRASELLWPKHPITPAHRLPQGLNERLIHVVLKDYYGYYSCHNMYLYRTLPFEDCRIAPY